MSRSIRLKNNNYWEGNSVKYRSSDLILETPNSNSDDSRDIVFNYGNGNEKARIWCADDMAYSNSELRAKYRAKNKSGTVIIQGTLMLSNDIKLEKHDVTVTVPGNSLDKYNLDAVTIPDGYSLLGVLPRINGFGDQWLVSLSYYSNKVVAMIESKYNSSLTSTISYYLIFIKNNFFE